MRPLTNVPVSTFKRNVYLAHMLTLTFPFVKVRGSMVCIDNSTFFCHFFFQSIVFHGSPINKSPLGLLHCLDKLMTFIYRPAC